MTLIFQNTWFHRDKALVLLIDEFLQAIACVEGLTQEVPKDGQEEDGPDTYEICPAGFHEIRKKEEYEQSQDRSYQGAPDLMGYFAKEPY
jgi:hypothetical protein